MLLSAVSMSTLTAPATATAFAPTTYSTHVGVGDSWVLGDLNCEGSHLFLTLIQGFNVLDIALFNRHFDNNYKYLFVDMSFQYILTCCVIDHYYYSLKSKSTYCNINFLMTKQIRLLSKSEPMTYLRCDFYPCRYVRWCLMKLSVTDVMSIVTCLIFRTLTNYILSLVWLCGKIFLV